MNKILFIVSLLMLSMGAMALTSTGTVKVANNGPTQMAISASPKGEKISSQCFATEGSINIPASPNNTKIYIAPCMSDISGAYSPGSYSLLVTLFEIRAGCSYSFICTSPNSNNCSLGPVTCSSGRVSKRVL